MSDFDMISKILYLSMMIPLVEGGLLCTKHKRKLASSQIGTRKNYKKLTGNNGLTLSKKFQLSFKKTLEGTCVIAPTGEGKTSSIFLPNLLSNDLPKSSLIISDPKGELFELTHKYQKSIGRTPILFEPLGNNAKYNPLDFCNDFTEVRELATNLIQNGSLSMQLSTGRKGGSIEWENMSIPLFTASLLNSKNIPEAVKFLINTPLVEIMEILGNNKNPDIKEQFNIFMASAGSPKTMSSIVSTLLTCLQLFTDHNMINTISNSTFAPDDVKNVPIALYIKYDEIKSNYLSSFLSVFYTQLINKLMYSKGLPIIFLLDEFQNIGRINNFEQIVSVCRSRKIGFLICLQNIVRLYDVYGKNNTTTILNNLKTKCILPSLTDLEALNYISNLCGDTEINTESINGENKTYSKTTRKLFTQDEIRRIKDDNILLIAHNKLPFLDNQNIYYNQPKYTHNVF